MEYASAPAEESFIKRNPYALTSFILSFIGFLLILIVIVFPALSVNIAVAGLYFLGMAFLCGVVGVFRSQDPKARWLAGAGILSSVSPFLLYFLFAHVIVPFFFRGIG